MTLESYYLSDASNLQKALDVTNLAIDELESIVGYFAAHSMRSGQMRGEVLVKPDTVIIRHHFTKKVLWKADL
jgi:hypothetical protein